VYDRILCPTDGSGPATAALEYALAVATAHDATLHVLGVADTGRIDAAGTDAVDALVAATERTVDEAAATGAALHPLHVVETGRLGPDAGPAREAGEAVVAAAAERAAPSGVAAETAVVENAEPARAVGEYATANGIDLAVVGTHEGTAFDRYVLGGVAAKLVRTAPVPVAWVRAPAPEGS
jgi:nucleotide-binding universal stress UspA family protein